MADQRPIHRRAFFREGLRELLKPLASAADPIEQAVRQFHALSDPSPLTKPHVSPYARAAGTPAGGPGAGPDLWLRPPGALPESQLAETCTRGGECVRVCPAQAIRIDPTGRRGGGLPFIDPDDMPCVVCDSLACMHACPSGALTPVPAAADIDMGTAEWRDATCVRTQKGEDCTICIDHCPLGSAAIELRDGGVHVIDNGCTGCGVCQNYCPTSPKSIVVIPTRLLPSQP